MSLTTLNLYGDILKLVNEAGIEHSVDLSKYKDTLPADRVVAAALQNDTTLVLTQPDTSAVIVDLTAVLEANSGGTTIVNSISGGTGGAIKTGAVVLNKCDVGLDKVDNTADCDKPVSNATKTYIDTCLANTGTTVLPKDEQVRGSSLGRTLGRSTDIDAGFDPVVMLVNPNNASLGAEENRRCNTIQAAYGIGIKRDITDVTTMRITGNLEVTGTITGADGGANANNIFLCSITVPSTYSSDTAVVFGSSSEQTCCIRPGLYLDNQYNKLAVGLSGAGAGTGTIFITDIAQRICAKNLCDVSDYVADDVTDGNVLTWNATGKYWEPRAVSNTNSAAAEWGNITGNITNQTDLENCMTGLRNCICSYTCDKVAYSAFNNSGEAITEKYILVGNRQDANAIPQVSSSGIKMCGDCFVYKCDILAKTFCASGDVKVGSTLCASYIHINGVSLDPNGFTETVTTISYNSDNKAINYTNEQGVTCTLDLSGISGTTVTGLAYSETNCALTIYIDNTTRSAIIPVGVSVASGTPTGSVVCYDGSKLVAYTAAALTSLPFSSITGSPTDNNALKTALDSKVAYKGTVSASAAIPMVCGSNIMCDSPLLYTGTGFISSVPICASNSDCHALSNVSFNNTDCILCICSYSCHITATIPVGAVCVQQLQDVDLTNLAANRILSWDATVNKWKAVDNIATGATCICQLQDVDTTSISAGNVLAWDASVSKWKSIINTVPFSSITGNPTDNNALKAALDSKLSYIGTSTVGVIPMVGGNNAMCNSLLCYTTTGFVTTASITASNTDCHALKSVTFDSTQSKLEVQSCSCCISVNIPAGVNHLCQLQDVNIGTVAADNILTWDAGTSKWKAAANTATYTPTQIRSEIFNSATWVVNHNLGYTPNICVYCCTGASIFAEIVKASTYQSVVCFTEITKGYVEYLV